MNSHDLNASAGLQLWKSYIDFAIDSNWALYRVSKGELTISTHERIPLHKDDLLLVNGENLISLYIYVGCGKYEWKDYYVSDFQVRYDATMVWMEITNVISLGRFVDITKEYKRDYLLSKIGI